MIFDTPPAGLFPDSIALARKTDELLFVTRYGKVSRHVVKRLIGDLKVTGSIYWELSSMTYHLKRQLDTTIQAIMVMDIIDISTILNIIHL